MSTANIPRTWQHIRFIHSSDLWLDRTLEAIGACPPHWENRFLNVSLQAAENLFQYAVDEDVDFILLSGNVLNTAVSPPGVLLFLLEQFDKLHKHGISVYWAGGELDSPEDWIAALPLPENVHYFPGNAIQDYYIYQEDEFGSTPLLKLVGMSRNHRQKLIRTSEFPLDTTGIFTIAVANGEIDPASQQRNIHYWALGGSNQRKVLSIKQEPRSTKLETMIHYPGAPLARSPQDIGQFGATLVEITFENDAEHNDTPRVKETPQLTYFSTSPVRWVNDTVLLSMEDDTGKLADELRQRLKKYRENRHTADLFINWFVDVPPQSPLALQLHRSGLKADLLSELRAMFADNVPMLWSMSLSVLTPERLPKQFYEQQTITGDYLRSLEHFQNHPQETVRLESYIPKSLDEETAKTLLLADFQDGTPIAQNILSEAAVEGWMILG